MKTCNCNGAIHLGSKPTGTVPSMCQQCCMTHIALADITSSIAKYGSKYSRTSELRNPWETRVFVSLKFP